MKVDILSPRRDWMPRIADSTIVSMAGYSAGQGVDIQRPDLHASSIPAHSRNRALSLIREDADYVLWCDDDMAPPADALTVLLKHDTDVVSGFCTTRDYFPIRIAAAPYDEEKDYFGQFQALKPKSVIKGHFGVGAAFLLMKKSVMDAAIEFHLSGKDWLEMNRRQLDRMHVRSQQRETERARIEAARRKMWEGKEIYLFQTPIDSSYQMRGEDIHLSWLLIKLGYEIWIDTNVEVLHIGMMGYGPHLLGVMDAKELRLAT